MARSEPLPNKGAAATSQAVLVYPHFVAGGLSGVGRGASVWRCCTNEPRNAPSVSFASSKSCVFTSPPKASNNVSTMVAKGSPVSPIFVNVPVTPLKLFNRIHCVMACSFPSRTAGPRIAKSRAGITSVVTTPADRNSLVPMKAQNIEAAKVIKGNNNRERNK